MRSGEPAGVPIGAREDERSVRKLMPIHNLVLFEFTLKEGVRYWLYVRLYCTSISYALASSITS